MFSHTVAASRRIALAATTLLLLAACSDSKSSDITGVSGLENFTASATGGVAGTFKGYSSQSLAAGQFRLGLATLDTKFSLALVRTGVRFPVGTYSVATLPSTTTGVYASLSHNLTSAYVGTSGSVTVTASSATSITGTFDINLLLAGGTTTTRVTGSFTSPCATGLSC